VQRTSLGGKRRKPYWKQPDQEEKNKKNPGLTHQESPATSNQSMGCGSFPSRLTNEKSGGIMIVRRQSCI
jgi:hypothetical protein